MEIRPDYESYQLLPVTEYPKFPPASIKHASIKEYITLEQIAVKFVEVPTERRNTGILPNIQCVRITEGHTSSQYFFHTPRVYRYGTAPLRHFSALTVYPVLRSILSVKIVRLNLANSHVQNRSQYILMLCFCYLTR